MLCCFNNWHNDKSSFVKHIFRLLWISKQTSVSIHVFVFFSFTLKRSTYHKSRRSNDTTFCNTAIVDISQPRKRQAVMFLPCDSHNCALGDTYCCEIEYRGSFECFAKCFASVMVPFHRGVIGREDTWCFPLDAWQTRLHPQTTRRFQRCCVSRQTPQNFMQMRNWHRSAYQNALHSCW